MLRLFNLYSRGDGVKRDLEEARRWLKKAADAGNPVAVEVLKRQKRPE